MVHMTKVMVLDKTNKKLRRLAKTYGVDTKTPFWEAVLIEAMTEIALKNHNKKETRHA